jgi:hypothetical protein
VGVMPSFICVIASVFVQHDGVSLNKGVRVRRRGRRYAIRDRGCVRDKLGEVDCPSASAGPNNDRYRVIAWIDAKPMGMENSCAAQVRKRLNPKQIIGQFLVSKNVSANLDLSDG